PPAAATENPTLRSSSTTSPERVNSRSIPMTTSSIQATEDDTTEFLSLLNSICEQQANICRQLDELVLLMQLPSESVLRVLEQLLRPINTNLRSVATTIASGLKD
ncbi:hypothetical protein, partial [Bordetella pseudohinzii]